MQYLNIFKNWCNINAPLFSILWIYLRNEWINSISMKVQKRFQMFCMTNIFIIFYFREIWEQLKCSVLCDIIYVTRKVFVFLVAKNCYYELLNLFDDIVNAKIIFIPNYTLSRCLFNSACESSAPQLSWSQYLNVFIYFKR